MTPARLPPVETEKPKNAKPEQFPDGTTKHDRLLSNHYWEIARQPAASC
jgi:hypothetical protein